MYNGPLHYNITTQTTSTVASSNVHITKEEEGIGLLLKIIILRLPQHPSAHGRGGRPVSGRCRVQRCNQCFVVGLLYLDIRERLALRAQINVTSEYRSTEHSRLVLSEDYCLRFF